jgi:hypothetical protein
VCRALDGTLLVEKDEEVLAVRKLLDETMDAIESERFGSCAGGGVTRAGCRRRKLRLSCGCGMSST